MKGTGEGVAQCELTCCQNNGVTHGLLQGTLSSTVTAAEVATPTQKAVLGTVLWSPEREEC